MTPQLRAPKLLPSTPEQLCCAKLKMSLGGIAESVNRCIAETSYRNFSLREMATALANTQQCRSSPPRKPFGIPARED
jgi:hypothetical protein